MTYAEATGMRSQGQATGLASAIGICNQLGTDQYNGCFFKWGITKKPQVSIPSVI